MTLNVNIFWTKIAMIVILVSMESYDKGLLEYIWFKNTSWNPDRESFVQNWENRDFFVGSKFAILLFQYFCIITISIVSKFKWKWIKTLDCTAHSVFKGSDLKIHIQTNVLYQNGHSFCTQPPTTMKFFQMSYICTKSTKVSRVYMHAPLQCQTK